MSELEKMVAPAEVPHEPPANVGCHYAGCDRPATRRAKGYDYYYTEVYHPETGRGHYEQVQGHPLAWYCEEHAWEIVQSDGSPEYEHECPACGCLSGVN